jgi:ATPase subunit of ABC transporter with duplicated ATPase domains
MVCCRWSLVEDFRALVTVENLSLRLGSKLLFKDVNLQLLKGSRYGLIGANGSGKTSFLKVLQGESQPLSGDISYAKNLILATLKQDHYLYEAVRIIDVVIMGDTILWDSLVKKDELLKKETFSEEDCQKLSELEAIIEKRGGYEALSLAGKLLEGLGILGRFHYNTLSTLSGGYKLRVLLAKTLFSNPDILLLDEPTNHLDIFSIKWLANYLKNYEGLLVLTSHDRDFLNNVCTHILDIDMGTIKLFKGNFDDAMAKKEEDLRQQMAAMSAIDKEKEKLLAFYARFGAKATKATQAQSRLKKIERLKEEEEQFNQEESSRRGLNLNFDIVRASSPIPLVIKNLEKAFAEKKVLNNLSLEIQRGEKVAFLGPNGIGKSTLLEIVTSFLKADGGSFQWGANTFFSYFPQDVIKHVDLNMTPLQWISQFDRDVLEEKLRALLGRVLFKKDDTTHKKLSVLSGGELSRLFLAKMMLEKHNVLILDEPTNHLDIEAIESLTDSLQDYEGTVLFVSHNSHFVSKIATRIVEISLEGIKDFKGTFEEYLKQTSNNYLSHDNALSKRYQKTFDAHGQEEEKNVDSSNWQERKKQQNQKRQAELAIKKLEDSFTKLEVELEAINQKISQEDFYSSLSRKEQEAVFEKKRAQESKIEEVMNELLRVSEDAT